MQVIKRVFTLCFFIPVLAVAQTTYLQQGDKAYDLLDRMEIKTSNNRLLDFSILKPYPRKNIVTELENIVADSVQQLNKKITAIDKYDLNSLYLNNQEYTNYPYTYDNKPVLKYFYNNKANLYQVNIKDFFLAINPVLYYERTAGSAADKGAFNNSRGVSIRGLIANKLAFSTSLTDNQEQGPAYFNNRVNNFHQVPGVGFWKHFKSTGFDYFDARGYVDLKIAQLINLQFGYDNNFIGDGYRSLFLSDYANSYLFLKLNVKKGRFEYQTLFTELMPTYYKSGDTLLDRKYASFYHLSYIPVKWLKVGVFEGVVFGNKNDFGLQNLNPIIFFRHVQGFSGSPDNAIAGLDFKSNFLNHFQLYGQLLLDEFSFSQLAKNNGYWANKTGYQVGIKYADAFTLKNLDLQLETNKVRPFSYAYSNNIANYTHYNLPLAHPLGANFQEYIASAKFHPFNKWRGNITMVYYTQGLDSLGFNFGNDPFENTTTRQKDYGYSINSGNKASVFNTNISLSYELIENLFLEGNFLYRSAYSLLDPIKQKDKIVWLGIRWNIFRRRYDL